MTLPALCRKIPSKPGGGVPAGIPRRKIRRKQHGDTEGSGHSPQLRKHPAAGFLSQPGGVLRVSRGRPAGDRRNIIQNRIRVQQGGKSVYLIHFSGHFKNEPRNRLGAGESAIRNGFRGSFRNLRRAASCAEPRAVPNRDLHRTASRADSRAAPIREPRRTTSCANPGLPPFRASRLPPYLFSPFLIPPSTPKSIPSPSNFQTT